MTGHFFPFIHHFLLSSTGLSFITSYPSDNNSNSKMTTRSRTGLKSLPGLGRQQFPAMRYPALQPPPPSPMYLPPQKLSCLADKTACYQEELRSDLKHIRIPNRRKWYSQGESRARQKPWKETGNIFPVAGFRSDHRLFLPPDQMEMPSEHTEEAKK